MTGLEDFLNIFGDVTVTKIVSVCLAGVFCYKVYQQIQRFFNNKQEMLLKKHEAEKEKDEQLKNVLEEVNKYPQYREQSRQIQKEFRDEIDSLKKDQQDIVKTLKEMQEKQDRRDRNKLRDRLIQCYRYYTQRGYWNSMESEAFWELFGDYEDAGGDGYMHTVVQPAMNLLKIVED